MVVEAFSLWWSLVTVSLGWIWNFAWVPLLSCHECTKAATFFLWWSCSFIFSFGTGVFLLLFSNNRVFACECACMSEREREHCIFDCWIRTVNNDRMLFKNEKLVQLTLSLCVRWGQSGDDISWPHETIYVFCQVRLVEESEVFWLGQTNKNKFEYIL